jgi:glycosyltransferase involved in cell wall biosynthesis
MRIMVVGGVARSLINFRGPLLKEMIRHGHEVTACAPDAGPKIRRKLNEMGVRYVHIPLARAGLSPAGDLRPLAALAKLIRRVKPDRIMAYTAKPVIYSHLAARMAGNPPVYGMITGLGYGFGKSSFKQRGVGVVIRNLYRMALKSSSGVFFQNPDDHAVFLNERLLSGNVPVTLINGSGVDLEWYIPQPLPAGPVFLFVARLLAEKGVRVYYQAASRLKRQYPQARFQIAGGLDPNPDSIRQDELQHWQVEGIIEYLGRLEDIRPAYVGARIFVLPSYGEGTPRTVLEAMAMGRPVITTDAPGCRETVEFMYEVGDRKSEVGEQIADGGHQKSKDGSPKECRDMIMRGKNGFLVPVRDPHNLAAAMERFILAPELAEQMGRESLRIALAKYDVHKVNAVILETMGL